MSNSFYSNHKNKINKIAIFNALKLGDLLCTIPAFRALRHAFPDAKISLIGLPWAAEFAARFNNYIDRFILFPGYPGLPEQEVSPKKTGIFLQQMQKEKFDLVLQMHGNGTISNKLIELFGAKHTAGFYPRGHYCPNPQTFMPNPDTGHKIQRQLQLLHFLGVPLQGDYLEFPVFEKDKEILKQIQTCYTFFNKQYVCIHAGGISAKKWPEKNFAQIADIMYESGFQIILTGTSSEKKVTETVQKYMIHPAINLSGKTNLGTLGALLQKSTLVITNDTGVSHMAAAIYIPSVIIFTNSDPKQWAPLNTKLHRAIVKNDATVVNVFDIAMSLIKANHSIMYNYFDSNKFPISP